MIVEAELGRLARFVAHDFKNYVMLIAGNTELALRELEDCPRAAGLLEQVLLAAQQSRELIDQVLAHHQGDTAAALCFDLRDVVLELPGLIGGRWPERLPLDLRVPSGAAMWQGVPSRWRQIVLNLVVNACEAMAGRAGRLAVWLDDAPSGIRLTVADEGPGIPCELLPKLFSGEVMARQTSLTRGLGLSIVRHLTDLAGGSVQAENRATGGAVFTVLLPRRPAALRHPRATLSPESNRALSCPGDPAISPLSGEPDWEIPTSPVPARSITDRAARKNHRTRRNVLYVEDEPSLRMLATDMLQMLNCRVTLANDGQEAWDLIQRSPDYFHLIFSDSRMPNLSGPQLAKMVKETYPHLPFVLVTAFSDSATEREVRRLGLEAVLYKPFMLEDLERTLNILSGGNQPSDPTKPATLP